MSWCCFFGNEIWNSFAKKLDQDVIYFCMNDELAKLLRLVIQACCDDAKAVGNVGRILRGASDLDKRVEKTRVQVWMRKNLFDGRMRSAARLEGNKKMKRENEKEI